MLNYVDNYFLILSNKCEYIITILHISLFFNAKSITRKSSKINYLHVNYLTCVKKYAQVVRATTSIKICLGFKL